MRRLFPLLLIVVAGAVVLAPVMVMLDLDRMPGDFTLTLQDHRYMIPVIWSLCASSVLGLLYWIVKR